MAVLDTLFRTKKIPDDLNASPLKRCLGPMRTVVFGVAMMLGGGLYTVTGTVVRDTAGPATILSFIIAAITASLSAICYAEFSARVPRAGSAYIFSYVAIGELPAFVVGWNFLLEYIIGGASVAISMAAYIDQLADGKISNITLQVFGTYTDSPSQTWAYYPNILALLIVLLITVVCLIQAKENSTIIILFVTINFAAITFFCVYGITFANFNLWTPFDEPGVGFMPYGFSGVLYGSSTLFFCYSGFDAICTMTEEVKNPRRNVPLAIGISIAICTVVYLCVTSVLTLMVPFYTVSADDALAAVFVQVGHPWAKYIMIVGACAAIVSNKTANINGATRVLYAMARDGLVFKWLGHVNQSTQIPSRSCVTIGASIVLMILVFNLSTLVEFLAIGTLVAYTLVVYSTLVLRYRHIQLTNIDPEPDEDFSFTEIVEPGIEFASPTYSDRLLAQFKNLNDQCPDVSQTANIVLAILVANLLIIAILIRFNALISSSFIIVCIVLLPFLTITTVGAVFLANIEPVKEDLAFRCPWSPWLPLTSIMANLILITYLNPLTWIRFAIWMTLGFLIYFGYGLRNSNENRDREFQTQESKIDYDEKSDLLDTDKKSDFGSLRYSTDSK